MKTLSYGLTACGILLSAGSAALAAPTNDHCNARQTIGYGTTNFNTTGADSDLTGSLCSYGPDFPTVDVWYEFTSDTTNQLMISSGDCSSVSYMEVSVYDSGCGGTELACGADLCNEGPILFNAVQGQSYVIRVGTYTAYNLDGEGSFRIITVPSNDNCNNSLPIGPGQYDFDTTLATKDGTAACQYSDSIATDNVDVWYTYTAGSTGTAIFEYLNCGGSSSISNVGGIALLTVYSGGCGGSVLECSTNGCQRPAFVHVVQGQSYLVRVAPYVGPIPGHPGDATLKITETADLPNDNCSGALPATVNQLYHWDTYGATTEHGVSCGGSRKSVHDVWYEFVAPVDGSFEFTIEGSTTWPFLSLYQTCGGPEAGCATFAYQSYGTDGGARLARFMDAGEHVRIRIGSEDNIEYSTLSGGLGIIQNDAVPAYDTCGGALNVSAGSTSFAITSAMSDDRAFSCSQSGGKDAFFQFTAPTAGTYRFDTCGSLFDTNIALLDGCTGSVLTCNSTSTLVSGCPKGRSAVEYALTAGQIISIVVDGAGVDDHGYGKLNITPPPPPPCAADFNHVNGVTVQDIFDFLTAWLAGNSSANFNGVNGVTVQDIFDFLTAWLAGC